jgi:hypothetical protein
MRRREFVILMGCPLIARATAALAQDTGIRRIGLLRVGPRLLHLSLMVFGKGFANRASSKANTSSSSTVWLRVRRKCPMLQASWYVAR